MRSISKTIGIALAGLSCFMASEGLTAGLPFMDGFETYAVGTSLSGTNGWETSASTVVVQTNVVWTPRLGTNAMVIPPTVIVSNVLAVMIPTNVWFDFYLTNSMAMPENGIEADAVDSNMTVQLFVETNGYPVVWHPVSHSWLVCSNDYWGTSTTNFNTNAWMHFTVCANYSNQTAAVFLNQHLLLQQVRFMNTNPLQNVWIEMIGGAAVTSFFDDVSARYTPNDMVADLDNDGWRDADEIQANGTVEAIRRLWVTLATTNLTEGGLGGGWLTQPATNVFDVLWTMSATNLQWNASNGFYAAAILTNGVDAGLFPGYETASASYLYSNTFSDVTVSVAFARMPAITTSVTNIGGNGVAGCTMLATASQVYPGGQATFTLSADKAYTLAALKTNGTTATTIGGSLTNAGVTITNIRTDMAVQGVFAYTGRRVVPGDYATIQDALVASLPGDTLIVNNGTCSGGLTLSNRVTLVATNTTVTGGLTVAAGTTGTVSACSGVTIDVTTINGLLVISNGTLNLGTLSFGAGGSVSVLNAAAISVNGVILNGTFMLDSSWTHLRPQTPPFTDNFERYDTGSIMATMGYLGWSTPDSNVVVQDIRYAHGARAVDIPSRTMLSNSMAPASSSNVWAEWYYHEAGRIDESTVIVAGADTNLTMLLFINTNGYVTVFNPDHGVCSVLSNDVWGHPVATLSTSDWPRIAVNMNFLTKRAAVLLNGRLLIQQLRFINTNQTYCAGLQWDAGTAGSTYLDDLNVQTNGAAITSDSIGGGITVAMIIDRYGSIETACGSVFLLR